MEQLIGDVCASRADLKAGILYYFNPVVGAHPSGLIGEDPAGLPDNLMLCISQVAIGRRSHCNVFGNDYPTRDGTGVCDYINILAERRPGDVAECYADPSLAQQLFGWKARYGVDRMCEDAWR